MHNNPINWIDPSGHWEQTDIQFSEDIQSELWHLTTMYYRATSDESRDSIQNAANTLRKIGLNGEAYTIIRSKTFIPADKVSDPLTRRIFSGDGDRAFATDSLDVRTYQYVIFNRTQHQATQAVLTGNTIEYDTDRNVIGTYPHPINGSTMEYNNVGDSNFITLNNHTANDAVKIVPWVRGGIDDILYFNVKQNGDVYFESNLDGFPAHEIYANSGNGYKEIYTDRPSLDKFWLKLLPGYGDKSVSNE